MTQTWEYGEAAGPEDTDAADPGDAASGPGDSASDPGGPASAPGPRFPWPPSEDGSAVDAFGETWRAATFDPGSFFARVPRDRVIGPALLYYLLLVVLVAGAGLFWESLSLFGGIGDTALGAEMGMETVSPLVGFLLTPFILLVMLFVSAGMAHVLLAIFRGAHHGFGTTLRVFCYAYSPGIFGVIPILGGLVGSIWMVVLLVIGLREAHETTGWKAALAVLLPVFLFLTLMVLAFLLVAATAATLL